VYLSLIDSNDVMFVTLNLIIAPLLLISFYGPVLWFNSLVTALEFETSRRHDISINTKRLLSELVQKYPIFFGVCGIQLTPAQFGTAMASLAAPGVTKLFQYISSSGK
jgi:hypothetical protein